ncbi:MAG: hypothetical protein A2X11_11985 [Bacteroidetes bacterium GWE2_42_24]|nr:MAG: hypothetical protein A2X11_11985 [Bacteroidetes bacterium GWE2_42_24]OFY31056.1 MAG: hypothetical protein A2X09_15935 [Bacteroidetes bacterium GWF2_43_11]
MLLLLTHCKKEPIRGWEYWLESPAAPEIVKVTPVLKNCEPPYPVSFTQETNNLLGNIRYRWSFGDGTSSNDQNPVHIYQTEGLYTITLIVSNEIGADTLAFTVPGLDQSSVAVNSKFSYSHFNNNNFAPAKVHFSNESSGANQFYWHFGDGGESSNESPEHVFDSPGTYTVNLKGECTSGESDEYVQQIFISPAPQRVFIDSLNLMLPSGYSASGIYVEMYHNTTYVGRTLIVSSGSFPLKFRRPEDFVYGTFFDFVQFTANETFRFVVLRDDGSQYPEFLDEFMLSTVDIKNNHYPNAYYSLQTVPVVHDLFIDLYFSY